MCRGAETELVVVIQESKLDDDAAVEAVGAAAAAAEKKDRSGRLAYLTGRRRCCAPRRSLFRHVTALESVLLGVASVCACGL